MESADLNSSQPSDAALEKFLSTPEAELPDNGFTHRVLQALPEVKAKRALTPTPWYFYLRLVLASLGTAAGIVLSWPQLQAVDFGKWETQISALANPAILVLAAIAVLSVAYALITADRDTLLDL